MSGDRASAIAAALLPVAGTLLFGWSAAPAVFLLWLGTLFAALEFVARLLAAAPHLVPPPPAATRAERVGTSLGASIAALSFASPALAAGVGVWWLLAAHQPQPWQAVLQAPGMPLWLLLELWLGGYRIRAAYRGVTAADAARLRTDGVEQFANLANRCMVLLVLAWVARWLGPAGLVVYLALASAFVVYVESQRDWLQQLERRLRSWGAERRARRG